MGVMSNRRTMLPPQRLTGRGSGDRGRWWQLLSLPGEPHGPPDTVGDPLAHDARMQRLEAVLFLARDPVSSRKLSDYANLADGTEARTLIRRLNQWYDQSGRAFRVEEVGGGFQLLSRPKFAPWLRRLAHVPAETRLSAPVLETLAVIAYRQPVLRADIEAIRGVNCGEILRQLMERDLVRICGRSQELGRPYLYATTKRFLQLFGLPNIDKLPRVETIRNISGVASLPSGKGAEAAGEPDTTNERLIEHKEESEVTKTMRAFAHDESLEDEARKLVPAVQLQAEDEDYEFEEEEEGDEEDEEDDFEDDEEEEDEEFEEEDEEFDDEFEEEEFEEEDEAEAEDDFEDEEWEEVEDEEEEDWDEEDDEDWGDDDEEEEEEEEEEEWD
jgi:segregation and condensation protein B